MVSCQNCGSKSSKDGQHCDHCGGKISKLLCRRCFYPLPASAAFCMLCGAEQIRGDGEVAISDLRCPHCSGEYGKGSDENIVKLEAIPAVFRVGEEEVSLYYHECPKCHGNWMSQQVLLNMLSQSAARKSDIEAEERSRNIEDRCYFKCPKEDCGEMLSRFLWSKIVMLPKGKSIFPIVDRCSGCGGLWLDNGELDWLLELGTKALPPGAQEANLKRGVLRKRENAGGGRGKGKSENQGKGAIGTTGEGHSGDFLDAAGVAGDVAGAILEGMVDGAGIPC
jgi:Zn-finger nucleic acid-binding protein